MFRVRIQVHYSWSVFMVRIQCQVLGLELGVSKQGQYTRSGFGLPRFRVRNKGLDSGSGFRVRIQVQETGLYFNFIIHDLE
jgi:hypothetical protein